MDRMTTFRLFAFAMMSAGAANAEIIVRNSPSASGNDTTRATWLADVGISLDQVKNIVDFEAGFVINQNVSGVAGLFPDGLVITDTSPAHEAIVRTTGFGGSNPVGTMSLAHNEQPFLELEFPMPGVDYLSLQDIDHTGTAFIVHFADGTQHLFSVEGTSTGGNSAEFVGIWRNDRPGIVRIQMDADGDGHWGIDSIMYGTIGPACDPDVNCDGAINGFDIEATEQAVNGDFSNFCQPTADLNNDGAENGFDIETEEQRVNGAPCF
ncbi:hypothetical protein PHYC_00241 [Phycisphaerales bacterium]|nr:hypothetical protein PHYC_00241 [Phycisphaerales bacterium]